MPILLTSRDGWSSFSYKWIESTEFQSFSEMRPPSNPLPALGEIEKRTAVWSCSPRGAPSASLCRWRAVVGCDRGLKVGSVRRCDLGFYHVASHQKYERTFSADSPGLKCQHSTDLNPHKAPRCTPRPRAAFSHPGRESHTRGSPFIAQQRDHSSPIVKISQKS